MTFNKTYCVIAILVFLIEVYIALNVTGFVRTWVGDVLVVVLIYCFVKAFWQGPAWIVALGCLIFAFGIEIGQYFNLVGLLGLENHRLARTVVGTHFAWMDLVAYTLGALIAYVVDKVALRSRNL